MSQYTLPHPALCQHPARRVRGGGCGLTAVVCCLCSRSSRARDLCATAWSASPHNLLMAMLLPPACGRPPRAQVPRLPLSRTARLLLRPGAPRDRQELGQELLPLIR